MAIKYSGENVLTYLLSLLNTKFKTKVDKVEGKGLSTNDLTNELKTKYDSAHSHSTSAHAPSNAEKNTIVEIQKNGTALTPDSARKVNITVPTKVSELENDNGYLTTLPEISTNIETDATSDTKTASPKAVKTYVDSKISSTYKPAGSSKFSELPALSASILGYVYNVTDAFTTNNTFVEGAGKSYGVGTNVVCVSTGEGYKWDVLTGFVDLSEYAKTADFVEYTNEEIQSLWDSAFTTA